MNEDPLGEFKFTTAPKKSGFEGKKWLAVGVIVLGVLLVVGAGFFFLRGNEGEGLLGSSPTPTPTETPVLPTNTPTPEPTPGILRSGLSVKVLNGTGISGEAGKLVAVMRELGYTKVEAGNASKSDYEVTEVSFGEKFPSVYKKEIMTKLEGMYKSVSETGSVTGGVDVQIIVGLRPGQSLPEKVSPTPTAKVTTSVTPTVKPTGTITPTVKPTGTVTPTVTP